VGEAPNHADEQYLARRALRDLPDTISRLNTRINELSADMATLAAHAHDPLTIGERRLHKDDALEVLGRRLDSIPERVSQVRRFPLGQIQGLPFGLVLHPGGVADVILEGAATRHGLLARWPVGPRAVMNAIERLAESYPSQCDSARSDLKIAQTQLRDHEARLGKPFPHEAYLTELTAYRDQLKTGLSQATSPATSAGQAPPDAVPVAELAERIRTLKAAHTIDVAPIRTSPRRIAAEVPVTARIRKRAEALPAAVEPAAEPLADAEKLSQAVRVLPPSLPESPTPHAAPMPTPAQAEIVHFPNAMPATPVKSFRHHVTRGSRDERQLSLF